MRIFNLFLNYSCNAKCGFCFNPHDAPQSEVQGLSTEKAAWSMLEAYRSGCRSVSFIGGEVTVRGDFITLVAAAKKIGYEDLRLVTNGLRLAEPGYVDALVGAGITGVDVSIHSHLPEMHDRLLGVAGAFDKAVEALRILKGRPVRLGLNVVVSRLNYRDLPATVEAFLGSHGIRNFSIFGLRYIGHMKLAHNLETLKVSMTEAAPFVRRALDILEREKCLESACVGDFTPCVLPGYEALITDWESGANPDRVSHPDGRVEDSEEVCGKGKRQVAACRPCVFGSRCLGVEGDYLSVFGEAEFKPLTERPLAKIVRKDRVLT